VNKLNGTLSGFIMTGALCYLNGCTSIDPYTHPAPFTKASTASPAGAASNAMTGNSTSNVPGAIVSGSTGNANPAPGTALGYKPKPVIKKPLLNQTS
jgi:hypothetical protein